MQEEKQATYQMPDVSCLWRELDLNILQVIFFLLRKLWTNQGSASGRAGRKSAKNVSFFWMGGSTDEIYWGAKDLQMYYLYEDKY